MDLGALDHIMLNDEFSGVMHMHGNMQGNKQGCE